MKGSFGTSDERRVVRVGIVELSMLPAARETGFEWLGAAEQHRLSAITSPHRRRQYLAGHWLAREMAAAYWGGSPESWEIASTDAGAPRLDSREHRDTNANISLSHSGNWVACAVSEEAVGLDLEIQSRPHDLESMAQLVVPEENAQLRSIPPDQREQAFYRFWTLKEARGKQRGTGLRIKESRQLTFCECHPDQAEAMTWQHDGMTLALFGLTGIRSELSGWREAPSPQFWRGIAIT